MQRQFISAVVALGILVGAASVRLISDEPDEEQMWLNCSPLVKETDIWQKSNTQGSPINSLAAYFATGRSDRQNIRL